MSSAPAPALRPRLILAAVAVLLVLPELLFGPLNSDSQPFNAVWLPAFAQEFQAGILYPRWLPDAWNGFGSPDFYFYPPLFFFAFAINNFVIGDVQLCSLATSFLFLLVSGLGMHAWLRGQTSANAALIGACAYMAAPYHLADIHLRGAVAESCIYAVLPFLMLSIRALGSGSRLGIPALAVTYALLILSHLPVALLTSVTLVPVYALFLAARGDVRPGVFLASVAAGLALGIGLAALYLLPALMLQDYIWSDVFWASYFVPERWFFSELATWLVPFRMQFVPVLTIGLLILAVARGTSKAGDTALRPWIVASFLCFVLISGLVPLLWKIDLLRKVQFPWRTLALLEFSAITAVALARPGRSLVFGAGLLIVAAAAVHVGWSMTLLTTVAAQSTQVRGAPEYVPAGFPIRVDPSRTIVPEDVVLPALTRPLVVGGDLVSATRLAHGNWDVAIRSAGRALVVMPIFYFPRWQAVDAAGRTSQTFPCTRYRLVCWYSEGAQSWALRAVPTQPEQLGLPITLLSLLAVVLLAALGWRQRGLRPAAP